MILPHHTQDEKAFIVPLIQACRKYIRHGLGPKEIYADLVGDGLMAEGVYEALTVEEVYLAYSAALIMEKDQKTV